jgi:opacity protein-like surface antigen
LSPWIIPAGVEINVISPPSGAVTVTSIGGVAGAGIEYELLDNVYLGLEGRYHWSPGDIGGVDTDGVTAGGSVAFGF